MAERRSIEFCESITGMLVDGLNGTPYVAASLVFNEPNGPQIEVPYLDLLGESGLENAAEWFSSRNPPKNLLLISLDGNISAFDCRYSGHTVNYPRGIGIGKITPTELVLSNRDGDLSEPLIVKELRSYLDGLIEWTRYGAIKQTRDTDDQNRIKKVTIELSALDEISWRQGAATLRLASGWRIDPEHGSLTVSENVSLTSSFTEPRPVSEHLAEHRKVASLLSFIFGCAIYFRRHEVRDDSFNKKALDGRVLDTPFYQLISRSTVKEHAKPASHRKYLRSPLVDFNKMGAAGLECWAKNYKTWSRFIHPAVSALNRPGAILENLVVNAAMSMEAAGNLIGHVDGEAATYTRNGRATTATYMYRCLTRTGHDWSPICESTRGLAQAIANNYNTIKHYDRGSFPNVSETYLVATVMALVIRMIATRVACPEFSSSDLFGNRIGAFEYLIADFKNYGLTVSSAGDFVARP